MWYSSSLPDRVDRYLCHSLSSVSHLPKLFATRLHTFTIIASTLANNSPQQRPRPRDHIARTGIDRRLTHRPALPTVIFPGLSTRPLCTRDVRSEDISGQRHDLSSMPQAHHAQRLALGDWSEDAGLCRSSWVYTSSHRSHKAIVCTWRLNRILIAIGENPFSTAIRVLLPTAKCNRHLA